MSTELSAVCRLVKGGLDPRRYADHTFAHYSIPAFDSGGGPAIELGGNIHSQKTPIPSGVVLVSKLNPRIPRVWYVNDEQLYQRICSTEFVALQPDRTVLDPAYLSFALRDALQGGIIKGNTAAATKSRERAKPTDFLRLRVKVPSLSQQRRIVDLLSRAENIVRMRREAEKKAKEIIPALFLDMFGDPATNPKGWREASLGQVIAEFRYGSSQKSSAHGDPVLRIPNVVEGNVDIRDLKFLSASDSDRRRYSLASGDILFVRTNGNPDYVGRCAVFEPPTDQCWLYASYLIRGRPLLDAIDPQFMQVQLSSVEGRRRLRARARTAAGQYNINVEGLRSTRIILPPLDRQHMFSGLVRQTKEILARSATASAVTDTTFHSLLGTVFREAA